MGTAESAAQRVRAGEAAVFCRVRPAEDGVPCILSAAANSTHVLVRDPSCAPSVPMQQAVRRYRLSPSGLIGSAGADSSQSLLFDRLGRGVFQRWMAGLSATVIACGESGAGKTHTIFGAVEGSDRGLCPRLLELFFDPHSATLGAWPSTLLGVSCWEVRSAGSAVDLLASVSHDGVSADGISYEARESDPRARAALPFVTVGASSLVEARRLIALARSRSLNQPDASGTGERSAPNRASLFVRLGHSNCALHLVDLVGTRPHGRDEHPRE